MNYGFRHNGFGNRNGIRRNPFGFPIENEYSYSYSIQVCTEEMYDTLMVQK